MVAPYIKNLHHLHLGILHLQHGLELALDLLLLPLLLGLQLASLLGQLLLHLLVQLVQLILDCQPNDLLDSNHTLTCSFTQL